MDWGVLRIGICDFVFDHIWDFGGLRSIQHSESEVTDTLTCQASFSVQHINVSVT